MSYTPHTWVNDEDISAARLNNLEEGIQEASQSSGSLICNYEYNQSADEWRLDKTVAELYDAYDSGIPIFIKYHYGDGYSAYESNLQMMPVVLLYNYSYQDIIKIVATKVKRQVISNSYYSYVPATVAFTASSSSEYPVFEKTIYVQTESVSAESDINP